MKMRSAEMSFELILKKCRMKKVWIAESGVSFQNPKIEMRIAESQILQKIQVQSAGIFTHLEW